MFDEDGYPTPDTLKKIARWPQAWDSTDPTFLIEYLQDNWYAADDFFVFRKSSTQSVYDLELHTAGWSGNEDIIEALEQTMFWFLYWMKSERGGHYYFEVPFSKIERSLNKKRWIF